MPKKSSGGSLEQPLAAPCLARPSALAPELAHHRGAHEEALQLAATEACVSQKLTSVLAAGRMLSDPVSALRLR